MTNQLPVTLETLSDADLNHQLGISRDKGPRTPRLKINASADDDNEKPLPLGTFYIDEVVDGKDAPRAYTKEVSIRIVTRVYQFQHFDQEKKKLLDESVMRTSLFAEFPSRSGKMKCGKLSKKQVEGNTLSSEQAKLQKDVKCRQIMFCLVSYKGTTQDGTEIEYKDKPCLWVVSQSAWTTMDEVLQSFEKQKRAALRYPVTLGLKKEKNGNVTYYNPVPKITNDAVTLSQVDVDAVNTSKALIDDVNSKVMEAWNKAIKGETTADDVRSENLAEEVGAVVVKKSKKDDLDDEIPF